ncbi:MAG: hypothetical protein ACYC2E_18140, partial [Sulfuricella sp.]
MTRGQDGSLLLPCIGLSPTIICQFVLAHSPIYSAILYSVLRFIKQAYAEQSRISYSLEPLAKLFLTINAQKSSDFPWLDYGECTFSTTVKLGKNRKRFQ